ncbi:MAG: PilZ domain-containing protein [Pirellulaceae bacterium]|nr:PilZ domain-containing protein [Planctomycetales bacterium]
MEEPNRERRRFFRLRYPTPERPSIVIGSEERPVTEISEFGLRIGSHDVPNDNGTVTGEVHLATGDRLSVTGKIQRRHDDETVIVDVTGITTRHIIDEQRRLLRNYPFLQ